MTEATTPETIEIAPIRETISGHTTKLQVKLDEDATDIEIVNAFEDACKEWGLNLATGTKLMNTFGRILAAVKKRRSIWEPEFGSLENFLKARAEDQWGVSVRYCYQALSVAENLHVSSDQISNVTSTRNLVMIAQAVKQAAPEDRSRVRRSLIRKGSLPVTELREVIESKGLAPARRATHKRLVRIVFEVSRATAEQWQKIVGSRSQSIVFSQWVSEHAGMRKPAKTAMSA